MYYDSSLKVRAAGASAVTDSTTIDAEFEEWYKVEQYVTFVARTHNNITKLFL